MRRNVLFLLWGIGFILCAAAGFIPGAEGFAYVALVLLAVASFIPAGLLLYNAHARGDRNTACLVRNLSAASLLLTMVLLILNLLSVRWPTWVGDMLYTVLLIVSAPMACAQNWLLGMFLWACMLVASVASLMKMKAE